LAREILAWLSQVGFEFTGSAKYLTPEIHRLARLPEGDWLLVTVGQVWRSTISSSLAAHESSGVSRSTSSPRAPREAATAVLANAIGSLAMRSSIGTVAAMLLLVACADSSNAASPDAAADTSSPAQEAGDETSPSSDAGTPAPIFDGALASPDGGCGASGGSPFHVTAGIDLCLPPTVCTSETCPPPLGTCVNGACQFKSGYEGLATLSQAWVTYYCTLSTGGCNGVTQAEPPAQTAAGVSTALGFPLCESDPDASTCVGIAASSPMVVGNSQVAVDPSTGKTVSAWGLGLTEASGLCYRLTGPGGSVVVALTDRCGGYCKCNGSGYQECGPCVSAPDMQPNCSCVGTTPPLYSECCGNGCSSTQQDCDWCASNNHPHFDLDVGSYDHLCGPNKAAGSCQVSSVSYVPCLTPTWPPGGGGGVGTSCKANEFQCSSAMPMQPMVPGSTCCCNYGLSPQADGTCN
jgi:hypothetical protein